MKNLILIISGFVLFSCGYKPSGKFAFTNTVSCYTDKNDSGLYHVTIREEMVSTRNLNEKLSSIATVSSDIQSKIDYDTCITAVCTQMLYSKGHPFFHITYYYIFTSIDGTSSVELVNQDEQKFKNGDEVNIFTNKKTLRISKII